MAITLPTSSSINAVNGLSLFKQYTGLDLNTLQAVQGIIVALKDNNGLHEVVTVVRELPAACRAVSELIKDLNKEGINPSDLLTSLRGNKDGKS